MQRLYKFALYLFVYQLNILSIGSDKNGRTRHLCRVQHVAWTFRQTPILLL